MAMRKLQRGVKTVEFLSNTLGSLSGWMIAIMMLLVVIEVFMRYVLNRPLLIADEFSGYLLVAVSFLGISYGFLKGAHVRITFVIDRLSKRKVNWLRMITLAIGQFFIIIMCIGAYECIIFCGTLNERSGSWINFPLKYPMITIFIGFVIFELVLVVHFVNTLFTVTRGDETA